MSIKRKEFEKIPVHLTGTVQFISTLSQDTGKVQPDVPKSPIISINSKKYPVAQQTVELGTEVC